MTLERILIVVVMWGGVWPARPARAAEEKDKPPCCEIVLIGSLKERHRELRTYSPEMLRDIVIACRPGAILIDMPPQGANESAPVSLDTLRRTPSLPPDVHACAQAAQSLHVDLLAVDIAEKEEHLEEIRYFDRLDQAHSKTREWMDWLAERRNPDKVALGVAKMTAHLLKSCSLYVSPPTVNFAGYDAITRDKYFLCFEMIPALLDSYEDFAAVAGEWRFLAGEWADRNRAIATRILAIARKRPGQRLAVVVHAERRYALRDLIEKEPDIVMKEYWEVGTDTTVPDCIAGPQADVPPKKDEEPRTTGGKTMHMQRSERDIGLPAQEKMARAFVLSDVNGSVTVTGGAPGKYGLKAILRAKAPTEAEAQQLIEQTGIESKENGGVFQVKVFPAPVANGEELAVDFQAVLPPPTNVRVETRNGHIALSEMTGKQECRSANGSIECDGPSSETVLVTQNGSVTVRCAANSEARCRLEARAENGSIELVGASGLSATLRARTSNGAIDCQAPVTIDRSSGAELQGRIGGGEGRILLETLNGVVTIR
jgi:hypothetical protein